MFACEPGDHGCRTSAGAAAHTCGDKDHMGGTKGFHQVFHGFFRRRTADVGPRAGAEAMCNARPKLDRFFGERLRKRLGVRVGDDEFDAFKL